MKVRVRVKRLRNKITEDKGEDIMLNLEVGMILTTRELVERWGTDKQKDSYLKSGKLKSGTKDAILKEVERECKLEVFKKGREVRYRVAEVFDIKLDKVENRGGSKPYLREELTTQLLYILHKADANMVTASFVTVAEMLNIINKDWKVGRNNIPETSKYLNIEEYIMYDFFYKTKDGFQYYIEATLNHLRDKALITWDKDSFKVCKWVTNIKRNKLGEPIIDNQGRIKYSLTKEIQYATEAERELILDVRNKVLDGRTYKQYFLEFGRNKFYEECNKIMREESNILYYIPLYTIKLTRAGIKREIERMEYEEAQEVTNCKAVLTSLKYGKAIAKTEVGFTEIDQVTKAKTEILTNYFIDKDGAIGLNRILLDIKAKKVI